ncbi:MAG: fructose-bisphosphate aldolase class I [Proteobacteria bacterium]|nr:fructose-bisphosphate aldolase class I [Pseudomonadota bacterium]
MNIQELGATAEAMVADHKGLLAADESTGTIGKRFESIDVELTEANRAAYRGLLFAAEGLGNYISGAILYDETIRQKAPDGTMMVDLLKKQGILPGIKVDAGTKPLAGAEGETVTEGLDGLAGRVDEYVGLGAKFAKWRAVIDIKQPGIPSRYAIRVNAQALARYARICQEGGLVPIVEPEVLMDGDHDIDTCAAVTEATLVEVFHELYEQGVQLEGMILKPNMVISGKLNGSRAGVEEVAAKTIALLKRTVPSAVPGIMFLSGGQTETEASEHLNAMNGGSDNLPWTVSYSYGRALQESALKAWRGKVENIPAAQQALLQRARLNSAACEARYLAEVA